MKAIRLFTSLFLILLCAGIAVNANPGESKPRVIVLTDIENEPDDAESLVRFLTYANQFDVEGIKGVGEGNDSEGSEWIIKALKKDDPRPLWVLAWGEAFQNDFAARMDWCIKGYEQAIETIEGEKVMLQAEG